MGATGPLRILRVASVPALLEGTLAASVSPSAPEKPQRVADDHDLNALWDIHVPEFDRAGLCSPVDAMLLETLLRSFQVVLRAHSAIGESVTAPGSQGQLVRHPALTAYEGAVRTFVDCAKQAGATLQSRARTPAHELTDEANPFKA